jgi:hypothetical protein
MPPEAQKEINDLKRQLAELTRTVNELTKEGNYSGVRRFQHDVCIQGDVKIETTGSFRSDGRFGVFNTDPVAQITSVSCSPVNANVTDLKNKVDGLSLMLCGYGFIN